MTTDSLAVVALGPAADAISQHLPQLVESRFASRLFAQDATLWGDAAEEEASIRLSWVGLAEASRPLVSQIADLRESLAARGVEHIVLCGMGGSSLAPEVICFNAGVPLTVLDSSDPAMVRAAVAEVGNVAVVVSSKSGSTVETDSQRRAFIKAFEDAGIDPTQRIIIVTDPGSPLDQESRAAGYTVINADPNVGGRFSALTAFGLVPSGLAGADISALLDDAAAAAEELRCDDEANPGLRLGAALGGTRPLRDKLVMDDENCPIVGFGDWAEQLIAESTGKDGTGLLPVVVDEDGDEEPQLQTPASDVTIVRVVDDIDGSEEDFPKAEGTSQVIVSGALGAQFLLWEVATSVAGQLLGVNPFDQPDVESAKAAAREVMDAPAAEGDAPLFTDGAIEVYVSGDDSVLTDVDTVAGAVEALVDAVNPDSGYLSVMAYLDRWQLSDLAISRAVLAHRTRRPVTFGWGPRFLHSTGQFHKGGPRTGVYLQITGTPDNDLEVPGKDFTFGQFIAAQAAGDASVLAVLDRPVVRLHLVDITRGVRQLAEVLEIPDPIEDDRV